MSLCKRDSAHFELHLMGYDSGKALQAGAEGKRGWTTNYSIHLAIPSFQN